MCHRLPWSLIASFDEAIKKKQMAIPIYFPKEKRVRVALLATHKQTFFIIIIIPRFLHTKKGEKDTPRPTVPKYLRSPTY